jgi:hypothetical protein
MVHTSEFGEKSGLFGLFYRCADGDPKTVEALPDRYTAADIAEKVIHDIDDWYEAEASVFQIAEFDGLQHSVHGAGATISWIVE